MVSGKLNSFDSGHPFKDHIKYLRKLAHLYGVQTSYFDVSGHRQQAPEDSLFLVLKALDAPIEKFTDIPDALREKEMSLWKKGIEPVTIAWNGGPLTFNLRLPQSLTDHTITSHLRMETGETQKYTFDLKNVATLETAEIEGDIYCSKKLFLPNTLPWGYHQLTMEVNGKLFETKIICAPMKAFSGDSEDKAWGVFFPLYALYSQRGWGSGDFSQMEAIQEWIGRLGGQIVATLPFLASFYGEPFDPSPYSPASRLFWNEFYLDLKRSPELKKCQEAQNILLAIEEKELRELRLSHLVDYGRQMALKRRVLEKLAESFFEGSTENHSSFQQFLKTHPAVEDYACFRAAGERLNLPWPKWPHPLREGTLKADDYEESARHYHLYVQWLAHEQIQSLADKSREHSSGLYLDLPLGVHPYAYDTWRKRDLFAENISGGAPPDIVFTSGQNWGFPPHHPEKNRKDGYRYVIDYLSHVMKQAGILRIDHVMGLHRIFWIPKEFEATKGIYVRYPSDELYAILTLESHKNKCTIVGENLGTVPGYVNKAMSKHNIQKMYVIHYELESKYPEVLRAIPNKSAASMNTHDMPPFAEFWEGLDIKDRQDVGLLDEAEARREYEEREIIRKNLKKFLKKKDWLSGPASERSVFSACLAFLASSKARIVIANLEDLWLEKQPQNLPGSSGKRPNWRLRARHSIEEFQKMPEVVEALKEINHLRRRVKN